MAFWHTPPQPDEEMSPPAAAAPREARHRVSTKYFGFSIDKTPNRGPMTQDRRLQTIRKKTVKVTLAKVGDGK